jgi:hypothetical protein
MMPPTPENRVHTSEDLQAILARIEFKNSVMNFDWRFEYQPVQVNYEGSATFFDATINQTVTSDNPVRKGWLIWASFARPDVNSGELGRGRGRDEIIWEGWTESAVVKTAWVIVDLLVKHELMEGYHYEGARIFNPHSSVTELASIQKQD